MLYVGVDPGASGGIAAVNPQGEVFAAHKMPKTDQELWEILRFMARPDGYPQVQAIGMLEKVHSSPQMGVASAFSFGGAYRACRMALTATMPFFEVEPQIWQRQMQCLTGGDKNVTKLRAKQLFPNVKVTHAIADALLLAQYCRLTAL